MRSMQGESSSRGKSVCKGTGVEGSKTGPRKLVWIAESKQKGGMRWGKRGGLGHIPGSCRCAQDFSFYPGASQAALVVESPSDARDVGFDPWVRKIPWRRKWQPTPVMLPGESHGQRSLAFILSVSNASSFFFQNAFSTYDDVIET